MTVASFFWKYNVGCILNYVRLIITREISCIYTVCPRIEFTRGKTFLFLILRKNFRGVTFFASSETPIFVIKISVLIHCILKLTFFVKICTLN
jgi:hypothetical protein